MKLFLGLIVVGFVGLPIVCCAAKSSSLVVEVVGPAPLPASSGPGMGALKVFSAFETVSSPAKRFEGLSRHTSYQIFSSSGAFVRSVQNQGGPFEDTPETVALSPGAYNIKALANGYGLITVPVIIAEGRITPVHLESSAPEGMSKNKQVVRLPGGPVVGWSAQSTPASGR